MSRPISVEELLMQSQKDGKPRFLSRKKRSKLKLDAQHEATKTEVKPTATKSQQDGEDKETTPSLDVQTDASSEKKRRKTPNGKYAFSWDMDDDTSGSFEPLVTLETADRNDDLVSREAHWSQKQLLEMTPRDWRILKDDFNITTKGKDIQHPLRNWHEESLLPSKLRDVLVDLLQYTEPTPIQRAAIPVALRHRDVVGIAETGSGKTLAFLLPIFSYLLNIEDAYMQHEHPQEANHHRTLALVLAPTRELALQITQQAEKFATHLGFSVVTIIGGHQYEETVNSLRNGVHIVVATPGRLVDSLERGIISIEKCYHLTMDEADKMIDMGFEKLLQQILLFLPADRQLRDLLDGRIFGVTKRESLMFTATLSPAIEKITKNYLCLPAYVFVGGAGELVANITQSFEYLGKPPVDKQAADSLRVARLTKLLEAHRRKGQFSVIVFANYKRVVELLAEALAEQRFEVAVVHGSKTQEARERAIEAFRNKEVSVLLATDVAARGLDVPHVSLVVNFQMSHKFDEYVHRIGRTGRAGREGSSHTFIDDGDSSTFAELRRFLKKGGDKVPDWLFRAA